MLSGIHQSSNKEASHYAVVTSVFLWCSTFTSWIWWLTSDIHGYVDSLHPHRGNVDSLHPHRGMWTHFILIMGMLTQLAAATAVKGTSRPTRGGMLCGTSNNYFTKRQQAPLVTNPLFNSMCPAHAVVDFGDYEQQHLKKRWSPLRGSWDPGLSRARRRLPSHTTCRVACNAVAVKYICKHGSIVI